MDPFDLLSIARLEREQAEQEHLAWDACVQALVRLGGGSLPKKQFLDFLRTQEDDTANQGFYRAADVYRRVRDLSF